MLGGDGRQEVVIDLANGGFAPGYGNEPGSTDEIEMTVLLGQGTDALWIKGTSSADAVAFGYVQGNMVPIPGVNLKANDTDYDLLYLSAEEVTAWGLAGNDVITGNDPATNRPAWLPFIAMGGGGGDTITGGDGADHLHGGNGNDVLLGGKGEDVLNAIDDVEGNDSLYGGGGFDTCLGDPGDVMGANCE